MVNTCSTCLSAHTHESNHKLYNTINIFISIESLFHTYDLSNPSKIKRWPNNKVIRYVTYHQTGKYLTKRKMQDRMLKNREKTEGWFEQTVHGHWHSTATCMMWPATTTP
jgi:surface polysaccharide O-acyltransferase-like enzyme